jgi:hypothetical protein
VWQDLHQELSPKGLTVVTVALDRNPEEARPWIEAAAPGHPSLVDTDYLLADLYAMVNVPTVVWIDEAGRIVRPNDVFFVSDAYSDRTGYRPERPIEALRAWVAGTGPALGKAATASRPPRPSDTQQLAKTAFALGWWLAQQGRTAEAEPHFARAAALAPEDFTIRRGAMRQRGQDPAGPEFFAMVAEWAAAGHDYYHPLADLAPPARSERLRRD